MLDPAQVQQLMQQQQPAPDAGFSLPAVPGMMMPEPPPQKTYDVKIKRCIKAGRMRVRIVPPEDFLIDPEATAVEEEEGRFFGDVGRPTRSDLIRRYPEHRKAIEEMPAHAAKVTQSEEQSARERNQFRGEANREPSQDQIEVYELYVNVDYDGDGVSEWRQIVLAGKSGERTILANEPWGGLIPYTDIVPNPIPHRRRGRSLFEDVYDIQRVKSVLLRQTLDNLYLTNNPRQVARQNEILNPDVLMAFGIGDTVWTKGDPNTAVVPLVTPFVGKDSFGALEYFDVMMEKRTGVSRSTMGLDLDALQNQTATAVNAQQSAAYTKVETYARNIAEAGGLKRLFKALLRLFVENQRVPKSIKLRNAWVEMDPRGWNAEMDCTINVGLGSGSRDRDLAMLQAIAQKQELVIQTLGPNNPICGLMEIANTYQKTAETAGIRNPEQFFKEVTPEIMQQFAQQQAQQPNPEAAKAQAQMQIEQMKLQANMQLEQARMQADAQRDAAKGQLDQQAMAQKAEIEKIQAQADIATQQQKVEAEIMLAREKFQLEAALKREEHAMKMQEMQATQLQREREAEIRFAEAANNAQMAREGHGQKLELAERAAKAKEQQPKGEK